MKKRVIVEVDIPDTILAQVQLKQIGDATVKGLEVSRDMLRQKFTIINHGVEDIEPPKLEPAQILKVEPEPVANTPEPVVVFPETVIQKEAEASIKLDGETQT